MEEKQQMQHEKQTTILKNSWICSITMFLSVSSVMLSTGVAVGSFNAAMGSLTYFFNNTYQIRNNGTSISGDMTTTLIALSGSMMLAGGFIGSTCSSVMLSKTGRKSSAVFMNWINIISTILMSVASFRLSSYECFIAGRFVFGIFCGFGMNLIPLIVAESSVPHRQAFYLSLIGVNLSGGGLLGLCMGFKEVLGQNYLAPLLLSLSCIPSIVYLLAARWLPDSPYTLMRSGRRDDAVASMKRLRIDINLREINDTLDKIQEHQTIASRTRRVGVIELFQNPNYRRIITAVLILFIQAQLCGINGLGMYTRKIFQSADFSESGSTTATSIVYGVQFVVALIGSYLVDRYGPKRLNYLSSFVMSFALILLFAAMTLAKNVEQFKYVSVVAVTIYVLSWAAGVNLTLFPMLAAYSTDITRESAFSFGGGVFWFFSWLVSFIFLYMLEALKQFTFIFFIILNFGFGLYVCLRMPETRGRTPKEITDIIQGLNAGENKMKDGEELTAILT